MMSQPFLRRVVLKNYKSIAACDVRLRQLTFLVGPNGAGKSNFLDALRFVNDSLRTSLDHALRDRGGINEVRRRSGGHPTHFGMRLEFTLRNGQTGHYAFRIGARSKGTYEVQQEECFLDAQEVFGSPQFFRTQNGEVQTSAQVAIGAARVSASLRGFLADGVLQLEPGQHARFAAARCRHVAKSRRKQLG